MQTVVIAVGGFCWLAAGKALRKHQYKSFLSIVRHVVDQDRTGATLRAVAPWFRSVSPVNPAGDQPFEFRCSERCVQLSGNMDNAVLALSATQTRIRVLKK